MLLPPPKSHIINKIRMRAIYNFFNMKKNPPETKGSGGFMYLKEMLFQKFVKQLSE
jgi:hypothetical protein